MKHIGRSALVLGIALSSLALAARAQAPAPNGASGVRMEVTPAGAFVRPTTSSGVSASATGASSSLAPSGLIWTLTDGGLAWIGGPVSLGNHGSEVFTEYLENNEADAVFSAFDTNPPTALWTDSSVLGAEDQHVASAESTGTKVSLHRIGGGPAPSTLSKYTNLSGTADWTYTFGFSSNGGTGCGISRDGQTIVAAATNPAAQTVVVAAFGPGSNVPLFTQSVPVGTGVLRGFDLSADGTTLYFSAGTTAYVFDLATQAVVFSTSIGASFDSHAISGDGSVFAFGYFGLMRVWEKVGATYVNTFNRTVPGSNFCAQIDISDDSRTIAYGFTFYSTYLTVQIEAFDVPTHAVTMTDVVTGTGSNQNVVSGVSISADGQRFAVGLWGDSGGLAHEMRLYARNQNAPLATVDLPGSVFGISISADGQRMVAGSKAVHANTLGNGGRIDLYGDASPFTSFCFGAGSPSTACPCGNSGLPGHGCENSLGTGGGLLSASGLASISTDSVVLTGSAMPNSSALYFQGTAEAGGGLGVAFGDGLRCAAGTVIRLGTKANSAGTSHYPAVGDLSVSARGLVAAPGVRTYQVWYRNAAAFCQPETFNLTNGVSVTWTL